MAKVIVDQTISLDGFATGPGDDARHPLGMHGGDRLFDWYQGGKPLRGDKRFAPLGENRKVVEHMFGAYGAFVAGRRIYDITKGWGGTHPMVKHVFIVTHQPPAAETVPQGESTFTFSPGVTEAIDEAKRAASGKAVAIGTSRIAQQALGAGLVDELFLHISPLVLGGGVRLFEQLENLPVVLEQTEVIVGPGATHVRYRVKSA